MTFNSGEDIRERPEDIRERPEDNQERLVDTGKDQILDTWVSTPRVDFASATSSQKEKCPLGPPKGGENEGSTGDQTVTTRTAQRNTNIAQTYLCCCGKGFTTERGMKVHRTKKGCLRAKTPSHLRTDPSDKSSGVLCQESHHSAENASDGRDRTSLIASQERRPRLNLPQAAHKEEWRKLDEHLARKLLEVLASEVTLDDTMQKFSDTIYYHCAEQFGTKEQKASDPHPKKSRRQRKMEAIRNRKNQVRRQFKRAPPSEKPALKALWEELKKEHSALRKAEWVRKKKSLQRKSQQKFFKDPFGFSKTLFEQPRSGTLEANQEDLEDHLRKTYANGSKAPLLEMPGLVWPTRPGIRFNTRGPSLLEVSDVIDKARSKSAPGPNGVPFIVYKRCPETTKALVRVLRAAWRKRSVCQEWRRAEGIYIPKEQDSKTISQFRPISLLNVEGKIFFAVMAKRLTAYLTRNGFIDTSVQKGGMPGMPGCLEHAAMIWEAIQRAKKEKLNLHVIWLDLANAYGSVPHQVIWLALNMYHVPDPMIQLLQNYFEDFQMRFTTKHYTTTWIPLEVGIAMGCTVSPILFVLVMQVILRSAEAHCSGANLGGGLHMPPLKAFMDDTTILASQEDEARKILLQLQQVIEWARMKFKPQKSRSLSLQKGRVKPEVSFSIAGEPIPTVSQQPVKSLGRLYDASLKDTGRARETRVTTKAGLEKIDKCSLQGKYKVWIFQHVFLPKLLWLLLIYDICTSKVERLEAMTSKFLRRWLGVPPSFSNVGLYGRANKLALPIKSITEEFKVGKARLLMMFQTSEDTLVRSTLPTIRTGRKWTAQGAVDAATESLMLKEVLGHSQTCRQGLGYGTKTIFWSKAGNRGKRDLVSQEVRAAEEAKRTATAVQQAQQGQWMSWGAAEQRKLSWKEIWHMAPMRLAFIIRATYDLLPTNANLARWGKTSDTSCPLCGLKQTLNHVLAACSVALSLGRYTWRHNQVLHHLAQAAEEAIGLANAATKEAGPTQQKGFVRAGESGGASQGRMAPTSILAAAQDWRLATDLKGRGWYPPEIRETGQRPDIVLYSAATKRMICLELTVPMEDRMEEWHQVKLAKYEPLANQLRSQGIRTTILAVEVGARGFTSHTIHSTCRQLGLSSRQCMMAAGLMSEAAERASVWIWMRRNTRDHRA